MFTPPQTLALRRMKLEDLIAKMEQIEQQAGLTLAEYPNGHTVERLRLIAAIARQVHSHLKDQAGHGPREAHSASSNVRALRPGAGSEPSRSA